MTDPTVFVVDDDDAVRDSLAVLLESAGRTVETFSSAGQLLAQLGPERRGCIVADIRMPGMDGLELQLALTERGIGLPVIVMTGHADVPLAVRAMKAGAIDFLEKPYSDDAMLAAVDAALARGDRGAADPVPPEHAERLAELTPRERDVLDALVAGHPNKMIAYLLSISPRTVEIHRARVMEKMQARSLSHLVRLALEAGVRPRKFEPPAP